MIPIHLQIYCEPKKTLMFLYVFVLTPLILGVMDRVLALIEGLPASPLTAQVICV